MDRTIRKPIARITIRISVLAMLATQAGMLAWSSFRHSPTNDELGHMVAGISRWYFGRFDIYCVNPPLTSAVATVPVVLSHPRTDWEGWGVQLRPEWHIGMHFLQENGLKTFWYFTIARWACIPLILLGGYFCYRWAKDLWGPASGLVALTLWTFSPTVLGNAAMITPDATAASMGVMANYAFWRWLSAPKWHGAALAGVGLGLALLSKLTWIILIGLWPLMWAAWWLSYRWVQPDVALGRQARQLVLIMLTGLYTLNAGYGFTGTFQRLDRFTFYSDALSGRASTMQYTGNRYAGTWVGVLPVPLPVDYVRGIDLQKRDFERNSWSFLRGEYRRGGWWYYYLYCLAVKETMGALALVLIAVVLALRVPGYSTGWRDDLALLLPGFTVLVLVSSQTGLNRYYRYVLPALPFFYIAASRVGRAISAWRTPAACATVLALAWSSGSSLAVFPHNMSYFNEFAGGPLGGHYHLIDANIDWGQDMLYLKSWAEEHPEARPLFIDANSPLDPAHLKLDASEPPRAREPGWYAIGAHMLHHIDGKYRDLLDRRPDAMVGFSIYIYHISGESYPSRARPKPGLGRDEQKRAGKTE